MMGRVWLGTFWECPRTCQLIVIEEQLLQQREVAKLRWQRTWERSQNIRT